MLNFAQFEDLYLAAIATTKDYLQRIETLIASNFKQPEEVIFVFPNEPLRALGPIRLAWLRACLLAQQGLLEGDLFTRLLSRALDLQAANFGGLNMHTLEPHGIVSSDVSSSKALGSSNNFESRPGFSRMIGFRQQDLSGGMGHLETIRGYSCGMIFALLTEKHGPTYPSQWRKDTRTTELPVPELEVEAAYQSSSNPYNFDQQVKGFDVSTSVRVPCNGHTNDPRIPVPARDPSREHLYREAPNRVYELDTYGDALGYATTGPTERTYTEARGGIVHQLPRKSLSPKRCTEPHAYPLVYKTPSQALLVSGQSIQNTRQPGDLSAPFHQSTLGQAGMPPPQGSLHYYASTTLHEYELDYLPLIQRRVFSREELQQPFSKLCDTPPQRPISRSIIGRRFFNFSRH